jgi:hypothetical protein
MSGFASNVLSCQERERLEEELFEARTRGQELVPAAASDAPGAGGVGGARAGGEGAARGPRDGTRLQAVSGVGLDSTLEAGH